MVPKNYNHEKIYWSIFFILWTIILAYSYIQEPHIETFEGTFVSYIEMYLNGHIQLDCLKFMPLFDSQISVDQSLPLRLQGIVETESYWPCFVSLFLAIHYISGMSPQLLVVLPIGMIFVPLIYVSITRSFDFSKNSRYIPLLTTIFFVIFLSTTRYYGSFYVGPPAIMLFLTIFLCSKKYIEGSNCRRHYILISILCTLSLSHYWHTPTMWTLYFVTSLFIVTCAFYILSKVFKGHIIFSNGGYNMLQRSFYLLVVTAVVILTFFHLWQSQYLDLFINSPDADLISLLTQKLFAKNPFPVPYVYNYKDLIFGQIYYVSYLLILVLSSIMIVIPILFLFFQSRVEQQLHIYPSAVFSISVIVTQVVVTATYFKSNSLGFPLLPLLLPLLSVWLFNDLDRRYQILNRFNFNFLLHSIIVILILLSVICAVCLPLTNQLGKNSETKYDNIEECFKWVYFNTTRDKDLIADFNIVGLFLQHEAKTDEVNIAYIDLSPTIYLTLVGDEHTPATLKGNYVVIDYATMMKGLPVHVTTARAKLMPEWSRINMCANQDKLYSDSHLSIFLLK